MEVERGGTVHTSRLYKILVKEREREELADLDPKGLSAFKIVKRTLCRKLSFNKVKKDKYNKVEEVPKKTKVDIFLRTVQKSKSFSKSD